MHGSAIRRVVISYFVHRWNFTRTSIQNNGDFIFNHHWTNNPISKQTFSRNSNRWFIKTSKVELSISLTGYYFKVQTISYLNNYSDLYFDPRPPLLGPGPPSLISLLSLITSCKSGKRRHLQLQITLVLIKSFFKFFDEILKSKR